MTKTDPFKIHFQEISLTDVPVCCVSCVSVLNKIVLLNLTQFNPVIYLFIVNIGKNLGHGQFCVTFFLITSLVTKDFCQSNPCKLSLI